VTEALPPPLTFEALRQAGIAHAQEASSERWTDYNLHDPGVTLLEQTSFALTELAYRSDIDLRDLLTGPDGVLDFDGLGLFAPDAVLRSAPVTRADLETCLGSVREAACVHLKGVGRQGLLAARVIPQEGFSDQVAVAAVARAFAANRPLCTDLAGIEAARAVRVRLSGRIVVGRRALPERVAAEVWLRVGLILRGTPLGERSDVEARGATRSDVAEEPMRYEGVAPLQGAVGRSVHIAALRLVPDLEEIQSLDLTTETGEVLPDFRLPDGDSYPALIPPGEKDGMTVLQDGVAVMLDHARLEQEINRLRAEFLASEANLLDPADWAKPKSGQPRRFDHVSVNATLPAIYAFRPGSPEALQLAGYRSLIDALLGAMTADLDQLPRFLSADGAQRVSHWPHLPQSGREAGLIPWQDGWTEVFAQHDRRQDRRANVLDLLEALQGEAMSTEGRGAIDRDRPEFDPAVAALRRWIEVFARHDRWHGRRANVLDLLIALQGEAMPTEGRSEIDRDRPEADRAVAALRRRAAFLHALPDINRRRGTGPAADDPGGVLLKLLCLADLPVTTPADILAAQEAAGFALVPEMPPGEVPRDAIGLPEDPLDLLLTDRTAPADEPSVLCEAMPWLATGGLTAGAFARAPLAESWLVAPNGPRDWQILFDAGDGDLYPAGVAAGRDAAMDRANRLRATFAALGRASEGAWLLEDIRLRGDGIQFTAHAATVVLPGWSPRTATPAYRRHVARLIDRVAPAHCRIRPLWLGPDAFARFAAACDAWQDDVAAGPALAAFLANPDNAT
jgi:hypothetical protein